MLDLVVSDLVSQVMIAEKKGEEKAQAEHQTPRNRIFVTVPREGEDEDIRSAFCEYGEIVDVQVVNGVCTFATSVQLTSHLLDCA